MATKINVDSIKDQAEKNYYKISQLIRQHGTPNPQFPNDKDIDYAKLRDLAGGIAGLGTILKNMKGKVNTYDKLMMAEINWAVSDRRVILK